jgi:hypothetical protein
MFSDNEENRKPQNEDEDLKKMSGTLPREKVNMKVIQTTLTIHQVILHTLRYNFVELLTAAIYTMYRKGAASRGILPCCWSPASKCRQLHISQDNRRLALIRYRKPQISFATHTHVSFVH